ncbi:uncharacterized protein LOC122501191 [Leptopilina heterotoma]|uniref:uncharacterized protein LOC122501191 n=1 Tax=Leptopilina heterotoma TaxID=63436 RepID=UPI001CA833A9|nr:uncharacterized protein LOC122501191 [Leptopilina heterotoma]
MIVSVVIPQGIKLIQVRDNIDLISQIVSTAELPYLVALTKMSVLYYNKEKMIILYGCMMDHWERNRSNKEVEIMMKKGVEGKKIAVLCMFLGHATMVARLVQWIFENLQNWNNSERFKNYTLYVEAYYPFNWNYTPMFEITCFIEYFGTFLATAAYTGTDGFFSQTVLHISGEYNILRLQLLELVNNFNVTIFGHEFDEKIGYIVDVHEHLNRKLIALFFMSYAFAQTAYNCHWYNLPAKKAKYLILLMQIGHKPVAITAGKFCVLNLILFGSIMKTSMGYLSVLITMRRTNK